MATPSDDHCDDVSADWERLRAYIVHNLHVTHPDSDHQAWPDVVAKWRTDPPADSDAEEWFWTHFVDYKKYDHPKELRYIAEAKFPEQFKIIEARLRERNAAAHPQTGAPPLRGSAVAKVRGDWFDVFGFCVPTSIREPWLGDLREDRKRMAEEGRSPFFIGCATAIQLVWAAVATVGGILKEAIAGLLRVS